MASSSAELVGPITVGTPSPPIDPRPVDLASIGYVEEEWFAAGSAVSYRLAGDMGREGRWDVAVEADAPYTTRFLVRRPADPSRFSGMVVAEWLNVSTIEVAPEWAYMSDVIVDSGASWVGVSVQARGVVGGSVLLRRRDRPSRPARGIKGNNPTRYGSLEHPGDTFAFSMFERIGAALRGDEGRTAVGGDVRSLIAAGQSQSAGFLTTYLNAVQPRSEVFDGFLVHSRGSGAALLDGTPAMRADGAGYRIRDDLSAPVLVLESETDVGPLLGYALARQADAHNLRVWEMAGTAHADSYLLSGAAGMCPQVVNDGPHEIVAKAALDALFRWVGGGPPPAAARPIRTGGPAGTTIVRDDDGIALDGIRTPSVDVPCAVLSGDAPPGSDAMCALFGSTTPFDPTRMIGRYGSRLAYLDRFDASLDDAIEAGFVRRADRDVYAARARSVEFG